MSDPPFRPRVVLVGPPGAGKSTVAQLLGQRLGVDVADTDALVEAAEGRSAAEIFVSDGEDRFRALEAAAAATALTGAAAVVALGGGAILDRDTRELLEPHTVVFLDIGLAEAARRVGLGEPRPVLLGNVRSQLKALLDARRPVYEQVATLTVRTDGKTAEEVAEEVAAAVYG